MEKIKVAVDMDNTIEDLVTPWLDILNREYGLHYTLDDIKYFDMEKSIPELTHEQLYSPLYDTNLFDLVKPYADAQYWLEQLNNDPRFEVYIATNTHYKNVSSKMEKILFKYFPYLNWRQLICIRHKQLLNVDVLIDDGYHNLLGGSYDKILFDMPYNRHDEAEPIVNHNYDKSTIKRATNWGQIFNYLDKMTV